MSVEGEPHSGSGQPLEDSQWRQYFASSFIGGIDGLGGGWIEDDEVTSSLQPQEPALLEEDPEEDPEEEPEEEPEEDPEEDPEEEPEEEPEEDPEEDPEKEPEEDPEEEVPEDVQEEAQEPAVDVGHHEEQHIGPEDFEEDMEDWDENLDDLEEGDEEFVWGDEDPESGLDEEPMPIRPPRLTHYYADKYYASQHRHAPVPLHPRDPYFPDFGYDHPPPAKRARVEPEVPQLRHEDIEQLLQAINRLCDELQQARKERGFLSSIWDWVRRRF